MCKAGSRLLAGLALLSISVCVAARPSSADVKDLGDICVTFTFDGVLAPPVTNRFGVLAYGASQQHLVLTRTGHPEHGSAVLAGDKILVTLNSSSVSADSSLALASTTHIILNASTLRGTFTIMTTSPPVDPQTGNRTGTAAAGPCQ